MPKEAKFLMEFFVGMVRAKMFVRFSSRVYVGFFFVGFSSIEAKLCFGNSFGTLKKATIFARFPLGP